MSAREVRPDAPSLRLGDGDFTICARVHTAEALGGPVGDIACQYDHQRRRGFNFGVMNHHLYFGIDDGGKRCAWTDCGRPGDCVWVCALTVYEGDLYAGTYEAGPTQRGHVCRYLDGTEWIDCGSPDGSNAVLSLAVHDDALYAGVGHYRAQGSALEESANLHPGGRVYRYAGGTEWVDCGKLRVGDAEDVSFYSDWVRNLPGWSADDIDTAGSLTLFEGQLYALPSYHRGMFRFDGNTGWAHCGDPGCRLMALGVFDGCLYAAGNEGHGKGGIYRYEGGAEWSCAGRQEGVDQVYSLTRFGDEFYAGTWPDARVFRFDGDRSWTDCGKLGQQQEVMGMAVYNGQLYAGTLPLAEVYRYVGDTVWACVGRIDHTPDVKYRRAWSMAVFAGRLFCGTLPSGHVHALETGQCVTSDRELPAGDHHVAAVRTGPRLELYVDGELSGASAGGHPLAHDIWTDQSVTVGTGAQGRFNGTIRDLRLFRGALDGVEINRLSR